MDCDADQVDQMAAICSGITLPDCNCIVDCRAMFAIQDACLMRGDDVRGLTLKELFVWDVPSVGPDNCLAFGFILGGGKTNQVGCVASAILISQCFCLHILYQDT
jgi:hypothetical protein